MNRSDLMRKAKAAADQVLKAKGYVSLVDVLLAMGRLSKENYERWRFRQIPHLERVLPGSLNEHAFLGRELRRYARDVLKLKPSHTVYMSWGKGCRQLLRFSKHNAPAIEELFSTHYLSPVFTDTQKARRDAVAGTIPAGVSMPHRNPIIPRSNGANNVALPWRLNSAQSPTMEAPSPPRYHSASARPLKVSLKIRQGPVACPAPWSHDNGQEASSDKADHNGLLRILSVAAFEEPHSERHHSPRWSIVSLA